MIRFFLDWVKNVHYTLVCVCLLYISRLKKTKEMLFMRGTFSFLYLAIWFDVTKCNFILRNSSWTAFSTIFVLDTNIIYGYNFVALLIYLLVPIDFTNHQNTMCRVIWGYIYTLKIKTRVEEKTWIVIIFTIMNKEFEKFVGCKLAFIRKRMYSLIYDEN